MHFYTCSIGGPFVIPWGRVYGRDSQNGQKYTKQLKKVYKETVRTSKIGGKTLSFTPREFKAIFLKNSSNMVLFPPPGGTLPGVLGEGACYGGALFPGFCAYFDNLQKNPPPPPGKTPVTPPRGGGGKPSGAHRPGGGGGFT